jgi:hypothetical protein
MATDERRTTRRTRKAVRGFARAATTIGVPRREISTVTVPGLASATSAARISS